MSSRIVLTDFIRLEPGGVARPERNRIPQHLLGASSRIFMPSGLRGDDLPGSFRPVYRPAGGADFCAGRRLRLGGKRYTVQ